MSLWRTEYRIARDAYLGYEVQARRWWLPFWLQSPIGNTHSTEERAEDFARKLAAGPVKYLGRL